MYNILNLITKYTYEPSINIIGIIILLIILATTIMPLILVYSIWKIHKELQVITMVLARQNTILENMSRIQDTKK